MHKRFDHASKLIPLILLWRWKFAKRAKDHLYNRKKSVINKFSFLELYKDLSPLQHCKKIDKSNDIQ